MKRSTGTAITLLPLLAAILMFGPHIAAARCGLKSDLLSHGRALKTVCDGFEVVSGLNYDGGDIKFENVDSPEKCCEACRTYLVGDVLCTAWTYGAGWTDPATGAPAPCWLKSRGYVDPPIDKHDGAISGKLITECDGFQVDFDISYTGINSERRAGSPEVCCNICKNYLASDGKVCNAWSYRPGGGRYPNCFLATQDQGVPGGRVTSYPRPGRISGKLIEEPFVCNSFTVYPGANLGPYAVGNIGPVAGVTSQEQCCHSCSTTAGCTAWVFGPETWADRCYLKSTDPARTIPIYIGDHAVAAGIKHFDGPVCPVYFDVYPNANLAPYSSGTIGSAPGVASQDQCCAACLGNSACTGWVFGPDTWAARCYLKNAAPADISPIYPGDGAIAAGKRKTAV